MLTFEQKKKRLAELYGVDVVDVPDDLDPRGDLAWMGQRRPRALAYRLEELEAMTDPAWVVQGWIPNAISMPFSTWLLHSKHFTVQPVRGARSQRWSRLSEQFLRVDKWSVCRG
jgi:hypothetical protein